MIMARVAAYEPVSGHLVRTYKVIAEDERDCLDIVASDRSARPDWRLEIASHRRIAAWDSPRVDDWTDAPAMPVAALG